MRRSLQLSLWLTSLGLVLSLQGKGRDQSSSGDTGRQQRAWKSAQPKKETKVFTNDDLSGQVKVLTDPVALAFLNRVSGRWNFYGYHKGNASWWYDHGTAQPKTEIHHLFGPTELQIEKSPEFDVPSITDRFTYKSVRQISGDLFDVELYKSSNPTSVQIKRFKLSRDGGTLQITADVPGGAEPTVQDLRLVDKNWSPETKRPDTVAGKP